MSCQSAPVSKWSVRPCTECYFMVKRDESKMSNVLREVALHGP
ncbi:unnamed protein product, partial [Staurois parvus]